LHKKSWRDDQRRIFKHIIPAFGPMALNRVSKLDLLSLHERISITAPMEANRVIELFKAIFERAREWDLVCGDNPARRFRKNRERSRARWLTREELLRLFAVLQNEDIYTRSAIFLWLLTGVRKNELLQAEWCQVDIPGRRMILAETKNGEDRIVQLSGAAVGLLEELPKAGRFVFPSPVIPDQALTDFKKPWARVRRAAGLKDATIHDLRRTMGSHLAQAGYSLHIIGRILGHKSLTTTKIYARLQAEPLIAAVEAHSERLMQIASEAA
jgi:integrase